MIFKTFYYLTNNLTDMKKLHILGLTVLLLLVSLLPTHAEKPIPDTVTMGMYITSIHDIDFRQNEYTVNLWLWINYKKREFDFQQNLEVPQAKSFTKLYATIDSSSGTYNLMMKLQCIMKDSWRITNFPFDRQRLRISFENSQFDTRSMVFAIDTAGKHFDPHFTLRGWNIDSFALTTGTKVYETSFGDTSLDKPRTEYSSYRSTIGIRRDASELFWKMFLGMYVSFLISYICFYIHADNIDSRFGLSVGALFAAIGNKYIIDSSLPETTTFTLVDALHGLTLFFILLVITASAYSLKLVKENKFRESMRFDMITAQFLLALYILINVILITRARG
ncbi:MAG: hypothetical protein C5B59_14545 [Bacteroidetes bacterium]|nr:MAG: hypothetical protein C5B59_14545 [Bacteroidota bacterium]